MRGIRDSKHRKKILVAVEQRWSLCPQLRLGQMLLNLVQRDTDLYYIEDKVLLKKLKGK